MPRKKNPNVSLPALLVGATVVAAVGWGIYQALQPTSPKRKRKPKPGPKGRKDVGKLPPGPKSFEGSYDPSTWAIYPEGGGIVGHVVPAPEAFSDVQGVRLLTFEFRLLPVNQACTPGVYKTELAGRVVYDGQGQPVQMERLDGAALFEVKALQGGALRLSPTQPPDNAGCLLDEIVDVWGSWQVEEEA